MWGALFFIEAGLKGFIYNLHRRLEGYTHNLEPHMENCLTLRLAFFFILDLFKVSF